MIINSFGKENVWYSEAARFIQQDLHLIALHWCVQGRSHIFPIGQQLVESSCFKNIAAENVSTNIGAFL